MTVIYLRTRMTTKYEINKEKRTVVCIITTVNDVLRRLAKFGLINDDYKDEFEDVRVYKGIAKCAPGDEWNEKYGRQLAEYRASLARQQDVNKYITAFVNDSIRRLNDLFDYGRLKHPHYPELED